MCIRDSVKAIRSGAKKPSDIAEEDRDYYLEPVSYTHLPPPLRSVNSDIT